MVVAAFVAVRGHAVAGVRVRSGVVPIGAIIVRVVFLPGAVLVMCERHALSPGDRGHALHRNGQRQQEHSKKAEKTVRHRRAL
jgi:hypothetical protein